ncbi:uncharacterized protein LOC120202089 [Hibiscus syriacus]|uniref:uncharacterized protein LOC120202089 n=1 Tax=Hibiscus syriacus TaxID=106335 RepID=UPI001923538A|nr:uncharacterized protein LOC120202089 [Hibiscus syriacus]
MEAGVPMLNCLMQHTLRSLCSSSVQILPLLQSGFMLCFEGKCLEIIHHQSGITEGVLLIVPKETKGIGFLFGKMVYVTSLNVRVVEVALLKGGLELIFSSNCLMESITMEKD